MTDQVITDLEWQKNVLATLSSLASASQTITYADLADLARIPLPHRIHKLVTFLEKLIADDVTEARPIRAAVVVSKRDHGLPADGFFDCCLANGLTSHPNESRAIFHSRLLAAVFSNQSAS